jgi:hypothetical protein
MIASVSGGSPPYSYQWSINGTPVINGNSQVYVLPVLSLSSTTIYTITVHVTDSLNHSAQASMFLREGSVEPPFELPSPLLIMFAVIAGLVAASYAGYVSSKVKKHA